MPTNKDAKVSPDPGAKPAIDLATIPEEQLLDLRLSELPVHIEGTWLQARVAQLHSEFSAKNIPFHPRCYLADEWLTPEGRKRGRRQLSP